MRARRLVASGLLLAAVAVGVVGCAAGQDDSAKSSATVRAARRAYDGAPPVVPHDDFGMSCVSCHNEQGVELEDVGFAPPSPHELTEGMNALSRCRQCHVFQRTDTLFVANAFSGLQQDLRRGPRLNALAPPTIPHKTFMRENCTACHSGAAAREEIRTPHPERARCRQCHVPTLTRAEFATGFGPGT